MLRLDLIKKLPRFIFLILSFILFSTGAAVAKTSDSGVSQEWASIDGFRSAKFGFSESEVFKAINYRGQVNALTFRKEIRKNIKCNQKGFSCTN